MSFERAKSELESQLFSSPINWGETQAYSLGACGNIFMNVTGREPQGIVAPGAEYASLREQIKDELELLRDPETGQSLVKQVHRREELYSGPYLEEAPDLIIEWHDYRYWGRGRYDQSVPTIFEPPSTWDFSDLPLTGTHRPDGIFVGSGPGIPHGQSLAGAQLIDLTPTALAFLGVPVPRSMDGRVLTEMFAPGSLTPVFADSQTGTVSGDAYDFSAGDREDHESAGRSRLSMTSRVCVVIPTWNRRQDLLSCLASLYSNDFASFQVVVVDNGSTDGTVDSVTRALPTDHPDRFTVQYRSDWRVEQGICRRSGEWRGIRPAP